MQRSVEELSPTKKRFKIEVPADLIEERITEALQRLRATTKIPGFRPGRAPLSLIEKRYGRDVERDVIEKLIPECLTQAIQEENVVPLSRPQFEDYDYKRSAPLKMTFTLEVRPEIRDLNYEGLDIPQREINVTEEEVDEVLKNIQTRRARLQTVDREATDQDVIEVEYDFVEIDRHVDKQLIQIGAPSTPEEINSALRGKRAGDPFETKVPFPEDLQDRELAGKELTIKGVIKEVKELRLPEINDELAKEMGFEDLQDLRNAAKESLLKHKREELLEEQREAVRRQLVDRHDFPIPEGMLENELQQLTSEQKQLNPDADEQALREELKDQAERNVKLALLLDVITEKEDIEISEEELKRSIFEISRSMYISPDLFIKQFLPDREALQGFIITLKRQKALDVLIERSTGNVTTKKNEEVKNE